MATYTNQQVQDIIYHLPIMGGFADALSKAMQKADSENLTTLLQAFPELCARALDWAERNRSSLAA